MIFLLDHDVADDIEYSLAALGHEVLKLREALPATTPDQEIFRLAGERGAILFSNSASKESGSLDFADSSE